MMKPIKLPLLNEVEKRIAFEEIFKENHIAVLDATHIFEIKERNSGFLRKSVSSLAEGYHMRIMKLGKYILAFRTSDGHLFLLLQNRELVSFKENELIFRKEESNCVFFEKYTFDAASGCYFFEILDEAPADCVLPESSKREHLWAKVFVHPEVETQSVDNSLFYGYIVPFWK